MDGVPFLFNYPLYPCFPFPRRTLPPALTRQRISHRHKSLTARKTPTAEAIGVLRVLERSLLLTLILALILAVQGAQRLGQLNRVPGVAHSLKGGASTGVTIRRTDTTGCSSAGRVSRVVQRGDIQCIELGIIQNIRQRNLFGNRLSGSLSSRCSRCLADGRTIT